MDQAWGELECNGNALHYHNFMNLGIKLQLQLLDFLEVIHYITIT